MNNKMHARSLLLCWLLAAGVLTSGCVTGRRTFELPMPAVAAASGAAKGSIALTSVTDRRVFENKPPIASTPSVDGDVNAVSKATLKTMIGRQRNAYGKAMGDIQLAAGDDVEAQMRRLVTAGLQRRGYTVTGAASGGNSALVEINKFWTWFRPGFWAVSFEADVGCALNLTVDGMTQSLSVQGYGKNTGQVASNANWQLAYARAFEDFLAKLDTALQGAGL
jgi:hypothetical protein